MTDGGTGLRRCRPQFVCVGDCIAQCDVSVIKLCAKSLYKYIFCMDHYLSLTLLVFVF